MTHVDSIEYMLIGVIPEFLTLDKANMFDNLTIIDKMSSWHDLLTDIRYLFQMILIVFYYLLFFISIGINEDGYDYDFYFDEERDYRGTPFKIRQEDTFFDNIFFDNQKYFFSKSGI